MKKSNVYNVANEHTERIVSTKETLSSNPKKYELEKEKDGIVVSYNYSALVFVYILNLEQ